MGFPEGRKLAKDVNKNSDECTERLSSLLEQTGLKLDMANRTLEGVAAQEDRYAYIPSILEQDTILDLQSEDFEIEFSSNQSVYQEFVCENTFGARHDGSVTLYADFSWETSYANHMPGITYKVTQIYPIKADVISGSFNMQDGYSALECGSVDFAVVKGGQYKVTFVLGVGKDKGSGTVSVHGYIRGIVKFIEGTSTKYYASVEGAPAIWKNNTEVKFGASLGGTVEKDILPSFFTPDIDGTVCISFDMAADFDGLGYISGDAASYVGLEVTNGTDTWKKSLPVGESSYPRKVSFDVPVQKDLSYTLRLVVQAGGTGTAYAFSITASNFEVSAVKVNCESTIVVPFVPADETIEIREENYILKKIPDSIDVQRHHYLVAMADKIYPGDRKAPYNVVFFDIKTMSPDYRVYNNGGSDGDRAALKSGAFISPTGYSYYIGAIDNEIFLCGSINLAYGTTLDGLIQNCPTVSITLY